MKPNPRFKVGNVTRKTVLASSVEVADHGAARNRGLLGRDGLGSGEGLWIVPCEAVHTFGMRFAIDLVYLDRRKIVKKVRSNVGPWRLSGCFSAHSVIELASGTVQATQTQCGDALEFSPVEDDAREVVAGLKRRAFRQNLPSMWQFSAACIRGVTRRLWL